MNAKSKQTTKRNDKCPCGSGKKYKNCCLQKDLEAQALLDKAPKTDEPDEVNPETGIPTLKLFILSTVILAIIGLIFYLALDMPRLGGSIFGCGMLILIVFCAFRNEPPLRKKPGDAGNIDFGNRQ